MWEQLVDGLNGNVGDNHFHELVILLDGHQGLIVEIVAVALLGIIVVVHLVALVVLTLETAHVLLLGTGILGSGEAILGSTQRF